MYKAYESWLDDPNTLSIKYESLVESEECAVNEVKRIFKFLELTKKSEQRYTRKVLMRGKDPDRSHTFRKGIKGSWKTEYTEEHIKAFICLFKNRLIKKYGYK